MISTQKHILTGLIILALLIIATSQISAQVETKNPTSEFILKGNHFIPGSPWLTIGTGWGWNFSEQVYEPNFIADFHYQLPKKKHCFGFGYLTSRDQFLADGDSGLFVPNKYVRHSTNSLHVLYGLRAEKMRHNFSIFAGPGYHWGYRHNYTDSLGYDYHSRYNEIGLFIKAEYTYKIFYDIGIGTSLWGSFNASYQVVGLSLHLYLSTAFKRKI